jgi:hypothetical protein
MNSRCIYMTKTAKGVLYIAVYEIPNGAFAVYYAYLPSVYIILLTVCDIRDNAGLWP